MGSHQLKDQVSGLQGRAIGGEKNNFQSSGPRKAGAHRFGERGQGSQGSAPWTLRSLSREPRSGLP